MEQKNYDLSDRLNWRQACTILGCSKSTLYRMEHKGELTAGGVRARYRWFSKKECQELFEKKSSSDDYVEGLHTMTSEELRAEHKNLFGEKSPERITKIEKMFNDALAVNKDELQRKVDTENE